MYLCLRPRCKEIIVLILLVFFFFVQLYLILVITHYLGADIQNSMGVASIAGLKIATLLLAFPFFTRGIVFDDILLASARLPSISLRRGRFHIIQVSGTVFLIVAALSAPIATIPLQVKSIRQAQIFRGIFPLSKISLIKMIWKHPVFFIWSLHVEPLVVRNIETIPRLYDALSIKGFRGERLSWENIKMDWASLILFAATAANALVSFR